MSDPKLSRRRFTPALSSATLRDREEFEDLTAEPPAEEHSLWDRASALLVLAHENRRLLFRCFVLGTILSVALAFLLPKRYEATARLMPPDNQMNSLLSMVMGGMSDKFPVAAGAGLLGMKSTGGLFVGVLRSRTIEDKIINDFQLQKVYSDTYLEDARKDLEARTEVEEDKKSGIIVIKVRDKDPERAAKIAGAYVDQLNRVMAEVSTSAARRERIFIEGRLKDVTADLNAASLKFSQFASKNSALDIKEQTVVMVGAAADLQGQLIAAQSELQGLSQVYGPDNVRVRAVSAKIASLRSELQKMAGSADPNKPTSEDALYPPIRKLPLLGVEWANLYRDTKVQEKVLELLTQQYEVAKIQEAKETPSVKTLDVPVTPRKKVWPPRRAIALGGSFLSLALPLGWILLRRRWSETLESSPQKQFARTLVRLFDERKKHKSRSSASA